MNGAYEGRLRRKRPLNDDRGPSGGGVQSNRQNPIRPLQPMMVVLLEDVFSKQKEVSPPVSPVVSNGTVPNTANGFVRDDFKTESPIPKDEANVQSVPDPSTSTVSPCESVKERSLVIGAIESGSSIDDKSTKVDDNVPPVSVLGTQRRMRAAKTRKERNEIKRQVDHHDRMRIFWEAYKAIKLILGSSAKYTEYMTKKLTDNGTIVKDDESSQESSDPPPKKDITKQLNFFTGDLRPYQVEGVTWLTILFENNINGILADEMGLGKTVQVIALICHLVERKVDGPFLIVAPLSTIPNWLSEFKRFAPLLPVVLLQGSAHDRQEQAAELYKKFKVKGRKMSPIVVTTYQVPMIETNVLKNFCWKYIIVDEGHRIKNHNSILARTLRSLSSQNRLLLTGTPLQNNIVELWSLYNFLMPDMFKNEEIFDALLQIEDLEDKEQLLQKEKETHVISTIHKVLAPFMLRRLKKDVLPYMVPKKEVVIQCPLSKTQYDLYSFVLNNNINEILKLAGQGTEELPIDINAPRPKRRCARKFKNYKDFELCDNFDDVNVAPPPEEEIVDMPEYKKYASYLTMQSPMTMFRKVVDHPYLVHFPIDVEKSTKKRKHLLIDEKLVTESGKMIILDQMLPKLKQRGHKVLLFSTLVMMIDIVEELLIMRGYNYRRLDGGHDLATRRVAIDEFNKDPDVFLFIISTRAGGLGLNLTSADTVIFIDRDWNPQVDIQAQDRCHRIGQTKPVVSYTLVSKNTIDQEVLNRGEVKRRLEKVVVTNDDFKNLTRTECSNIASDLVELKKLLDSEEPSQVVDTQGAGLSDKEWDRLLDRTDLYAQMAASEENKENKS